jgi:hypothetical protein
MNEGVPQGIHIISAPNKFQQMFINMINYSAPYWDFGFQCKVCSLDAIGVNTGLRVFEECGVVNRSVFKASFLSDSRVTTPQVRMYY